MTWLHQCPTCGRFSMRHSMTDTKPTCKHEYHAPERCGECGNCRNHWEPEQEPKP